MADSVGDLLVAVLYTEDHVTTDLPIPEPGWTSLPGYTFTDPYGLVTIMYRYATASEPTSYTFTGSGSYNAGAILRYSNVNQTTPFVGMPTFFSVYDSTPSNQLVAPSMYAPGPGTLVVGFTTVSGTHATATYAPWLTTPALTQRVSTYTAGSEGLFIYDAPFTNGSCNTGEILCTLSALDTGIGFQFMVNTTA